MGQIPGSVGTFAEPAEDQPGSCPTCGAYPPCKREPEMTEYQVERGLVCPLCGNDMLPVHEVVQSDDHGPVHWDCEIDRSKG